MMTLEMHNNYYSTDDPYYATLIVCRLCLGRDAFMLPIFHKTNITQLPNGDRIARTTSKDGILEKLREFITLKIDIDDGLPGHVCHRCLYKVELCLDFKTTCYNADATLRGKDSPSDPPSRGSNATQLVKHLSYGYPGPINGHDNIENVVTVVDPNIECDADADDQDDPDLQEQYSNLDNENNSDLENESNMLDVSEYKNVFMCQYCDKAFVLQNDCLIHEQTLHDIDTPFLCHECDMAFGDRVNYTAHLKSVHQNDKPFGCPECDRAFGRRSDLRKHTIVHTGIKPFTCPICLKSFSRNTNLNKHLRIHSGHKPHVCAKCPRTFISKGDLSRHALIHSGVKPFSCGHCHQSFGRRDKLIRHEKKHIKPNSDNLDDQRYMKTELSGFLTQHLAQLTQQQQDEQLMDGDIKEEVDSDQWDNSENMVISLNPYLDDDPVRTGFSQPDQIEDRAKDDNRKPEHVTGDDGFQGFSTEEAVESKTSLPHLCPLCPKVFNTEVLLNYHLVSHQTIQSELRPHKCPICSKGFMRKRELDRHMTIHTGIKPFACPSCPKSFGRKDKLVRHMRIHVVNLQCKICSAKFNEREELMQHMRSHITTNGQSMMLSMYPSTSHSM